MRRGLETFGVIAIVAVSWFSIARLHAGSATATAQVSIIIPERDAAPEAAAGPAELLPVVVRSQMAAAPGSVFTTTRRDSRGRSTVVHTEIPQI